MDLGTLPARFAAKVQKTDGCWLWTAATDGAGYGCIFFGKTPAGNKRPLKAPRAAWMIYRGELPSDAHVLHRCDNPACVNPEHLFLGSNLDNIKDRMSKGRTRNGDVRGEKNPRARLTLRQVEEIRADAGSSRQLAKRYGVSKSMINYVRSGTYWANQGTYNRASKPQ